MPYYFYDATYILVLIGALISMFASWNVQNTFRAYSRVWNSRNIPSQDIAQMILHDAGIYDVRIERIRGDLTDHYSPNEKVLRLSDSVYGSTSVAAIGVAAHECGHAIQHQEGYAPLKLRSFSVPLANIGSRLSWPIIVLGLILGGMMAIDMGGPFNKAAYVFGTAAIAAGNYDIMAAVMIGGMTPPCAIALATLLFKNKFTKEERDAGPTNFIMGLAFITEGAIPFAASDPLHVLPSCIVGSALAGALSMAFHCTLMAPHGGIFVFPVVGNALMYLVALVAGTIVSALLLGVLKKKVA